jgi:hypothetical protein
MKYFKKNCNDYMHCLVVIEKQGHSKSAMIEIEQMVVA